MAAGGLSLYALAWKKTRVTVQWPHVTKQTLKAVLASATIYLTLVHRLMRITFNGSELAQVSAVQR